MTEEEAKNKWCPMVRFGQPGCNSDSQTDRGAPFYKCIASDCMMWVEEKSVFKDGEESCTEGEINRRITAGEFTFVGGHCGLIK